MLRQRIVRAGGHHEFAGGPDDRHRIAPIEAEAVAELSRILGASLAAPRPEITVVRDRHGERLAGCDGVRPSERGDHDGFETIGRRAVADLTVIVMTPRPDAAIGGRGQREIPAAGDRDRVRERVHLHGSGSREARPLAECAGRVVAPGPDAPAGRPIAFDREREIAARSDARYTAQTGHHRRCRAIRCRAVAQLPGPVATKRPHGPIALQREGVRFARRDGDDAAQTRDLGG